MDVTAGARLANFLAQLRDRSVAVVLEGWDRKCTEPDSSISHGGEKIDKGEAGKDWGQCRNGLKSSSGQWQSRDLTRKKAKELGSEWWGGVNPSGNGEMGRSLEDHRGPGSVTKKSRKYDFGFADPQGHPSHTRGGK